MPLIVLCGLPCSGKSTIAKKLVEKLEAAGIEILVKDETAVAPDRNAAYKGLQRPDRACIDRRKTCLSRLKSFACGVIFIWQAF